MIDLFKTRLLFFVALVFCANGTVNGQGVFDSIGREVNDVFERVKESVVKVKSDNGVMMLTGSGFFIDQEGTLLTSSLIVVDDTATTVESEDKQWEARVLGKDLRSGLALLKVYGVKSKPLVFAPENHLKAASAVVGVGYPYNLPVAPSFGLVAGFDFQYFTSTYTTKDGAQYFYCYEQGYLPIEKEFFLLVVKKEFS